MHIKGVIYALFLFIWCPVRAQSIQWASDVVGYSSQRSETLFSAMQAIGRPNKYPDFSFTPCAWMPTLNDPADSIFIHVAIDPPSKAAQVLLVQSFQPEKPVSIYLVTVSGKEIHTPVAADHQADHLFLIPLKKNDEPIASIRVVWPASSSGKPFQVDAIGITTDTKLPPIPFHTDTLAKIYFPKPLTQLNSSFDEVLPVVSPDGKILYFDRKRHPMNTGVALNDDIWFARFMQDSTWSTPINIGPPLNDDGHNFINSVSSDGNTVLLGNTYYKSEMPTQWISMAHRNETGWSNPVPVTIIGFSNKDQFNEFSMSADGQFIVMSIESEETHGMRDIYVSKRISEKYYGKPKNLGSMINTAAVEMSPFIAADGITLYFASNGLPGYGGYDIYVTKRLDDSWENWTEPLNLGPGINTADWEAYFTTDAFGSTAYFCSSRGVDNLDIYSMPLSQAARPDAVTNFTGRVIDKSTTNPIQANIEYALIEVGKQDEGLISYFPTEEFNAYLRPGSTYLLTIRAEGYFQVVESFETPADSTKSVYVEFQLIPKEAGTSIVWENIYFQVNTSQLIDSSYVALEQISRFLLDNPRVNMDIIGHTNGLCDDEYCLSLSTRRAKTIVDYLLRQGVSASRLQYRGMGKTQPIGDNETAEGRRKNQRVEFVLTQVE